MHFVFKLFHCLECGLLLCITLACTFLRGRKKAQGKTADLKCIRLFIGVINLLLCKSVQQVIPKINIVTNNTLWSSAWAILEHGYYDITFKDVYL